MEILKNLKQLIDGTLAAGNIKSLDDAAILVNLYHSVEHVLLDNELLKKQITQMEKHMPITEEP